MSFLVVARESQLLKQCSFFCDKNNIGACIFWCPCCFLVTHFTTAKLLLPCHLRLHSISTYIMSSSHTSLQKNASTSCYRTIPCLQIVHTMEDYNVIFMCQSYQILGITFWPFKNTLSMYTQLYRVCHSCRSVVLLAATILAPPTMK